MNYIYILMMGLLLSKF